MPYRILIVDDESDIVEFIKYNLEKEGFETFSALNGEDAVRLAREYKPNLILMDVMMPIMDGVEACRQIKQNEETKNIFIAFLTARSEEYSEVAGFDAGADDYIPKPIKPRVLISRIKAMLKRGIGESDFENIITVGDMIIDKNTYLVKINEEEVALPKKEFDLLFLLASKPGKVFTRDKILSKVWGDDVLVVDRTIDVHIRKIREKIGENRIFTIKGVGYKLEV